MSASDDRPQLLQLTPKFVIGFMVIELLFTSLLVGVVFLLCSRGHAVEAAPATGDRAVKDMLDKQVADWNKGDLNGFMVGYWKDEGLTFYSGGTVTKGWQGTMDRYQKRYKADGKEMGTLVFSDVAVSLFDDDRALARGRWKLTMKDGTTPNGLFTLILRRIDDAWRVVHDHTSAAEKTP